MNPVSVIVADDEPLGRQRIVRLLAREPDAQIVAVCADGPTALAAVRRYNPDLLFLDVQMPSLDGFSVIKQASAGGRPAVVFVTAHDQYALQAFDADALDYLLKPFDEERFHRAYLRARERLNRPPEKEPTPITEGMHPDRLAVKREGAVYFVKIADVDWVEAASNYVRLHTGQETHLLRESMTGIGARLDPRRFLRIHRTAIVNVDRIRELQPWFSGEYIVILQDGTKLKVSRGYRNVVTQWLGKAC